jgi:hypothetical protein
MKRNISKVVYKGGSGSGHRGHKGIPGHQGGSLPDNEIPKYDPNDNSKLWYYLRDNSPLRKEVVNKIIKYFASVGEIQDREVADTNFEILLLDKTRFDRYNEKWKLGLSDSYYEKLVKENKELERTALRLRINYEDENTIPDASGYKPYIVSTGIVFEDMRLFGKNSDEALNELYKYPINIRTGDLSEWDKHRFFSNIITAIEYSPEIKAFISKGALKNLEFDDSPASKHGTAAAVAMGRSIKVLDRNYGLSASVFCHEMGHVVESFAYDSDFVSDVRPNEIFGDGKRISKYAWTSPDEDFAETFVAIIDKQGTQKNNTDIKDKINMINSFIDKVNKL